MKSCPLGHTCSECLWLTHIRGTDKNTGQEIDKEGCAVAFLPTLLIENAYLQHSTGAAIENFRNEMTQQNNSMLGSMLKGLTHDEG